MLMMTLPNRTMPKINMNNLTDVKYILRSAAGEDLFYGTTSFSASIYASMMFGNEEGFYSACFCIRMMDERGPYSEVGADE